MRSLDELGGRTRRAVLNAPDGALGVAGGGAERQPGARRPTTGAAGVTYAQRERLREHVPALLDGEQ